MIRSWTDRIGVRFPAAASALKLAEWHGRALLCAYARLVFSTDARSGALLVLATFTHWRSAMLGALAALIGQSLAVVAKYPRDLVAVGYYGYNALLVGLALGAYQPLGPRLICVVVAGAVSATLLSVVMGDWLYAKGLPLLALPFVVVASFTWHTTLADGALPYWLAPDVQSAVRRPLEDDVLAALGAIVFAPTALGGALVLMAALCSSRIVGFALASGAVLGVMTARALDVNGSELLVPAAYNAGLTFAALSSAFLLPSLASVCVAAGASALAAWVSVSLMLPFAPLAIPVLAWPFVLVTPCVLRGLALRAPALRPHPAPLASASPEQNLEYVRTFAKRLRMPGPPRFALPVQGPWCITQGFDGALTHCGPWRHALDFEVVDAEGFPFRGYGTQLSDYYCYGEPVVAAGSGTVVAIHDGAPDNQPGEQDLQRPWGNAVVVQHGIGLFSVVAHLKPGSICVALGQSVRPGEQLAECGASGRSPRPHLHFQVQTSAALGTPTSDFRLLSYAVQGRVPRLERVAVPREGQVIQASSGASLSCLEQLVSPGNELVLADDLQRTIRLRSEVSALGEASLVDVRSGARLYFAARPDELLFTALRGSASPALAAILQVAPCVPCVELPRVAFHEELSPDPLLPLPLRQLFQLLQLFMEPASACVVGTVERTPDGLVVESECEVRFFGWVVHGRRGRLVVDRSGLASVELSSTRSGRRSFHARRAFAEADPGRQPAPPNNGAPPCVAYH